MQTYNILNEMIANKLAVVIRGENFSSAYETAQACIKGNLKTLEVTFTVPEAERLIRTLSESDEGVLVGAGTVLDSQTARIAILAGAKFIVSPGFDQATAKLCNRYGIPYLPGCMTVNEMLQAVEYGVSVIKLFPGDTFEPSFIKNIHGPLPHLAIMPTGGINLDNIGDWLKAGATMVCVSGEITRPAKTGDFEQVEELARAFQQAVTEIGD